MQSNKSFALAFGYVIVDIAGLTGISAENRNGDITPSSDVPAVVDSPDEMSNRLMEFFRQIYELRKHFWRT